MAQPTHIVEAVILVFICTTSILGNLTLLIKVISDSVKDKKSKQTWIFKLVWENEVLIKVRPHWGPVHTHFVCRLAFGLLSSRVKVTHRFSNHGKYSLGVKCPLLAGYLWPARKFWHVNKVVHSLIHSSQERKFLKTLFPYLNGRMKTDFFEDVGVTPTNVRAK